MTIHTSHPFADPAPDPARRLRGRLGGAVTLWCAGEERARAGLTVSSVMVAHGEPARVLALLDPDADLTERLLAGERATLAPLPWSHRHLAEMFAGTAPAPGGVFAQAAFASSAWGPRLADVGTWAGLRLDVAHPPREVGWSLLVTTVAEHVEIADDEPPALGHRRGRFVELGSDS